MDWAVADVVEYQVRAANVAEHLRRQAGAQRRAADELEAAIGDLRRAADKLEAAARAMDGDID